MLKINHYKTFFLCIVLRNSQKLKLTITLPTEIQRFRVTDVISPLGQGVEKTETKIEKARLLTAKSKWINNRVTS
jgi:hypothetical protein